MKEIQLPFNSEAFAQKWQRWKQYKKEQHRFTYKGEISESAALERLFDLSNGNEQNALLLIENAIQCGWKGIYPVNTNTNGTNNTVVRKQPNRGDAGREAILNDLREELGLG